MKIDDSFKMPGAVPFKWEIRPGVPKLHNPSPRSDHNHFQIDHFQNHSTLSTTPNSPLQETPPKLKPPPAGSYYFQSEPRTHSCRTSPRSRHFRMAQPDVISSAGCFPSPLVKQKNVKKRTEDHHGSGYESEYSSDSGNSNRRSVSSRKSVSTLPSSFASYQSSPRPGRDAEWAAFGLF